MEALTPAERRGALVVVLLLALGAFHDLWRVTRPLPVATRAPAAPVSVATASAFADTARSAASAPAPGPLDLNRATARDLDALPGIGPVLAGRIVDHRARNGPFARPEDLLAVRGIGPRLLERLRPRVTVDPPRADTSIAAPQAPAGGSRRR